MLIDLAWQDLEFETYIQQENWTFCEIFGLRNMLYSFFFKVTTNQQCFLKNVFGQFLSNLSIFDH